ncbi:MAG: glycoside hydrolase family 2 [Ignavibacteriaceae bacterium]|nr:glycoside hydrolase family 2 [Ignavibacteriaceae bacterium]
MKKFSFIFMLAAFTSFSQNQSLFTTKLTEGWQIYPSEKVEQQGKVISSENFTANSWYAANLPSTVFAALVRNGIYKDIYFGENLKSISKDQFLKSWWYRKEFIVEEDETHKYFKLRFSGINYRANIWLNGELVSDSSEIYGAFRRFDLDITRLIRQGEKNVLAVEVFPPVAGDYTIGFVDWNPDAPDKNMGIWREVELYRSGDVSIDFPFVKTKFTSDEMKTAELTISAEITNHSSKNISGIIEGKIEETTFSKNISLAPNERKLIILTPNEIQELKISNPRIWWTHDLGKPELYNLQLSFKQDSIYSDQKIVQFGIREITDYFNENGYRGYKLNGRKVLIRGGGWVDNLILDNTYSNLEAQIKYAKHMNLNALRFEGFWGSTEDVYNLCDKYGILLMVGITCHWEWGAFIGKPHDDFGTIHTDKDIKDVSALWKDQIKWLRNHPSIFVWLYGSDKHPKPEMEQEFLKVLSEEDPLRPYLASAADKNTTLSGRTGVKMKGPYDFVPPHYWFTDTLYGGAYGFNTETGPGPQVPIIESIKKFIPADHLWPIDSVWNFHCAGLTFNSLERYTDAMNNRLGKASNLNEYSTKSQFLNYEGMRAMFEAFVANRYNATGIIQWMYNAAWPKLWWQFYDYYLIPTAAFYAARKACEPTHIFYNYGNQSIIVSNNSKTGKDELTAEVKVFNSDITQVFSYNKKLSLKYDENIKLVELNKIDNLDTTYFVDLRLFDKKHYLISSNFYCLSTKEEILDYSKNEWFVTPAKQLADLTKLNSLPNTELEISNKLIKKENVFEIEVELNNNSEFLALQIELNIFDMSNNEAVVPVFWEDNYLTLLPHEKRIIKCSIPSSHTLIGRDYFIKIRGWNIGERKVPITN